MSGPTVLVWTRTSVSVATGRLLDPPDAAEVSAGREANLARPSSSASLDGQAAPGVSAAVRSLRHFAPSRVQRNVTPSIPYASLVLDVLSESQVARLIANASSPVVVLERIARGAGATRWFALDDPDQLVLLAQSLSPGSSVSFYFDGRLASHAYDVAIANAVLTIAEQDGDAVIGTRGSDEIQLDVEFIAGPSEIEEYESRLPHGTEVIYGRFPARDNDGERAVTLDLPDLDGIVRAHPH